MERRRFLQNLSTIGLGLLYLPSSSWAANAATCTKLPLATQAQIRHGLFALPGLGRQGLDLKNSLQKNVFYKNGYAAGDGDLILYSFNHEGVPYLLGIDNNCLTITANECTTVLKEDRTVYEVDNLQLQIVEGDFELEKEQSYLFLPLQNTAKIDGERLSVEDDFIFTIEASQRTIFIDQKVVIIKTK